MKNIVFLLLFFPAAVFSQTVTILPTDAMVSDEVQFTSLGEASYAILSPNAYSEEDLAVILFRQPAGHTIDFHLHYETDEYFFVQKGKMTMTIRDSTFTVSPGSFVHIPSGTPHSHGNTGEETLELLLMYKPGKMAELFRAWGNMVKSGITDPDQLSSKLLELPQDFDVEFIDR